LLLGKHLRYARLRSVRRLPLQTGIRQKAPGLQRRRPALRRALLPVAPVRRTSLNWPPKTAGGICRLQPGIKRKTPVFRYGIHPPGLAATCAKLRHTAPRSSHSAITEGMITRRRLQSVRACGAVPGIKLKSAWHALCISPVLLCSQFCFVKIKPSEKC